MSAKRKPKERWEHPIHWHTTQASRNVFEIAVPCERKAEWEFWALLSSCEHVDASDSIRTLQREHNRQVIARKAVKISLGDFFDVTNSSWDKRASKISLRREHGVRDYLDEVVRDAVDLYAEVAPYWAVLGIGNHESKVLDVTGHCLTSDFIGQMKPHGGRIFNGGYSGWVVFKFQWQGLSSSSATPVKLYYEHGYGGGTGETQHKDRAVAFPDADIVASGHNHRASYCEFGRTRISPKLTLYDDAQVHIKIPTYKNDRGDGFEGWHAERGGKPRTYGAWWVRFYWDRVASRIAFDCVRAK